MCRKYPAFLGKLWLHHRASQGLVCILGHPASRGCSKPTRILSSSKVTATTLSQANDLEPDESFDNNNSCHTIPYQVISKMFSCVNYERGCRGRCNSSNGRCDSCVTLNLQSTRTNSSSSTSSASSQSSAAYSAMTSSFASLSALNSQRAR